MLQSGLSCQCSKPSILFQGSRSHCISLRQTGGSIIWPSWSWYYCAPGMSSSESDTALRLFSLCFLLWLLLFCLSLVGTLVFVEPYSQANNLQGEGYSCGGWALDCHLPHAWTYCVNRTCHLLVFTTCFACSQ